MRRVHLFISGIVQGVCFRAETLGVAKRIGVNGWARNIPDGRVECLAEGEDSAIDEFIRYCHEGPPGAYVRRVDLTEEKYAGEFSSFEIKYGC